VNASPALASTAAVKARILLGALRVRTLPAAAVPVAVGAAVAARHATVEPLLAAAALGAALSIQIGTNLVNDWADFRLGADGPGRIGPPRAAQSGLVAPRTVALAGAAAFGAAALLGLWLVARGGAPILAIGVASIAAGVAYTAGPYPLAWHGLGEVFVFAFFGPVALIGTELLLGGRATALGAAVSLPIGLLASAILVVNNVRDVDGDRAAGKRTVVVRLGRRAGRWLYVALVGSALAAPLLLWTAGLVPVGALASLAALPLAPAPARAVLQRTDGASLNGALAATGRLHLAFGALLAAGLAPWSALAT
jgi:1,4-dihydroxy-2-naphthoate polyprenyltransferase